MPISQVPSAPGQVSGGALVNICCILVWWYPKAVGKIWEDWINQRNIFAWYNYYIKFDILSMNNLGMMILFYPTLIYCLEFREDLEGIFTHDYIACPITDRPKWRKMQTVHNYQKYFSSQNIWPLFALKSFLFLQLQRRLEPDWLKPHVSIR